jgi:hypothetical protein
MRKKKKRKEKEKKKTEKKRGYAADHPVPATSAAPDNSSEVVSVEKKK